MDLRDRQEIELFKLIRAASDTSFGQLHLFSKLKLYEDFRDEVPVSFYSDISDHIDAIKQKGENPFWPESPTKFAVSAGTSGSGKHLPLTEKRLQSDQHFMQKLVYSYFRQRPNIFRLWGQHISLPGSLEQQDEYEIGEISAFTAQNIPWWLRPFQLLDTEKLVHIPFGKKIELVLEKSLDKDVTAVTGTPSWLLTIFQGILQKTQAGSISEVWPRLKLLVCGGVKLANYRPHLEKLLGNSKVDFIETYGASEGYFAFSDDLTKQDMRLVTDNGIFYEFIPHPLPDTDSLAVQETVPLWEVEIGTPYAMIVSTNAGLWRYALNDIVQFRQTDPPRIEVMGRVSEMLDDFGEALYAYEAEQALREAAHLLDLKVGTFTLGATLESEQSVPHHHWFIQTYAPIHIDTLNRLAHKLDTLLQKKNRHYAIRRESNALGMPNVHSINQQQINNWLRDKGKQKAQGKLPAILKDERDIQFFK